MFFELLFLLSALRFFSKSFEDLMEIGKVMMEYNI